MPSWLQPGMTYLFHSPGQQFSYYVPMLLVAIALLWVPAYHYALASRLRFRRFPVHLHLLDRLAAWSGSIGVAWLLVLLMRKWDLPVLSWRLWLYLVVCASAVIYLWGIAWLYARAPRLLDQYEAELQRKRYLAGATPSVPAINRKGRRAAR